MPDTGLERRYSVRRCYPDGTSKEVADCFVLRPVNDPAARAALKAYAEATTNDALQDDLFAWLDELPCLKCEPAREIGYANCEDCEDGGHYVEGPYA